MWTWSVHPASLKVTNSAYIPPLPQCLHGIHRDNLPSLLAWHRILHLLHRIQRTTHKCAYSCYLLQGGHTKTSVSAKCSLVLSGSSISKLCIQRTKASGTPINPFSASVCIKVHLDQWTIHLHNPCNPPLACSKWHNICKTRSHTKHWTPSCCNSSYIQWGLLKWT